MNKLIFVFTVLTCVVLVGCSKKTMEITDFAADNSVGSGVFIETQGASLE